MSMTPNVINFVEQQKIPKEPSITFDSSETIRAPDGPLYIVVKVKNTPCRGVLIVDGENGLNARFNLLASNNEVLAR